MKSILCASACCMLMLSTLYTLSQEPKDTQIVIPEEIVFVPLTAIKPSSTSNPFYTKLIFATLALAGAFGKILIDSGTSILLVDSITTTLKSLLGAEYDAEEHQPLINECIQFIKKQAQTLVSTQEQKND
ncbi:MAG: hypothetical protein AB7F19_01960 [Candidatus Babeliales bacterium]